MHTVGREWKSILVGIALFGFVSGAEALTVENLKCAGGEFCEATISYAAAATDRAVFVGWGSSDKGATLSGWGASVESAVGLAAAGSTRARVTLPADVVKAKVFRLFLVADGCHATYLRSNGQQYIETDVYPGPLDTKVFIDFQMQDTDTVQQRLFGNNGNMYMQGYLNGSKGWSWSYSNGGNWTAAPTSGQVYATKDRTQVTLDGPGNNYKLVINGVQKVSRTIADVVNSGSTKCTNQSNKPLLILADAFNTDKYGNLKLYSMTVSKKDGFSRNFVPGVKGGVAGVHDTVTDKWFFDALGNSPFFAGAPVGVEASEASGAVAVPQILANVRGVAGPGSVDLAFAPSSADREVWFCWGDADKGATFSAWPNNERIGTVAANAGTGSFPLPPSAEGAKAGRCFLLPAGGDYDCAYLRSERTQYIDTGIPSGTNMAISVDFKMNNTEIVQQRPFGVNDCEFTIAAYINGNGWWAWAAKNDSGNWTSADILPVKERTTISIDCPNDLYTIKVGGKQVYSRKLSSVDSVKAAFSKISATSMALLGARGKNNNGVSNMAIAELYGAEISLSGTKARSFSPCVVNGEAKLYDAVSKTYFGNAYTNGWTQFIPGGRKDSPTASLVGEPLDLTAAGRGTDVFADASFWLRGMAEDANGNGVVDNNEFKDSLGRKKFPTTVYGAEGRKMVYSNELVRIPGRGVDRMMQTLYLPQTLTITNEENHTGYIEPTSALLTGVTAGCGNHWSTVIRVRPDGGTPPNGCQWIMQVGHTGGKGLEFGFLDSGTARRFGMYISAKDNAGGWTTLAGYTVLSNVVDNSWVDIAVVADGMKVTAMLIHDWHTTGDGNNTIKGAAQIGWKFLDPAVYKLQPGSADLRVGAEASANDKRLYPMGANDNSIKCFRGSIQQLAFWNRSLSRAEMFMALGHPRTDLWRVGVEDGDVREFSDEAKPDGFAVDDEKWPLRGGLAAGESVTMTFPLWKGYENLASQMLRWKSLANTAAGSLSVSVNGNRIGAENVKPGDWTQWYVPARYLLPDTNTVTITRADGGAGVVVPDAIALGGGWQIGKKDNGTSEFSHESYGLKDYYVASGCWRDIRRALFGLNSTTRSNTWFHFNMPEELAGRYRWRFNLSICTGGFSANGVTLATQPLGIDLNGKEIFAKDMKPGESISLLLQPEDLPSGENVFNFRNGCQTKTGGLYYTLDTMTLEPRSPYGMSLLIR